MTPEQFATALQSLTPAEKIAHWRAMAPARRAFKIALDSIVHEASVTPTPSTDDLLTALYRAEDRLEAEGMIALTEILAARPSSEPR